MKIGVYQRHIDSGFGGKGSERFCPIARAMTEQTERQFGIWDGKAWDLITGEYFVLPEDVTQRYLKYDKTGVMKPFDFEIDLTKGQFKPKEAAQVAAA